MDIINIGCPTKFLFGRGSDKKTGELCKMFGAKKVMIIHTSGFLAITGVIDRIKESIEKEGIDYVEMGCVQPNPRLAYVRTCIDKARSVNVDFVLAVGGGSVIDTAKAVAAGVKHEDDVWEIFKSQGNKMYNALPIGCVASITGSGSEGSSLCYIVNEEDRKNEKISISSEKLRPKFSILNPELTYSVSKYQSACGISNMMVSTIERYFCDPECTYLDDQISEGILRTVIKYGLRTIEHPNDYEARAQLMLASASLNCTAYCRDNFAFSALQIIQNGITELYDSFHGEVFATICPCWMEYIYSNNINRFAQYANKVWGAELDYNDTSATAMEGIKRTKDFFNKLGLPIDKEMLRIQDNDIEYLCAKKDGLKPMDGFDSDDLRNILKLIP